MASVLSKKLQPSFRVSDAHTLTSGGEHARYCVEHSLYAVFLTGKNYTLKCEDGREFSVSKSRLNQVKDIQAGSVLYMGDTVKGKVFRGEVVKRFLPNKVKDTFFSVRREVSKKMKTKERHKCAVEDEVELLFQVNWILEDELTDEWKERLRIGGDFCKGIPNTVFPLSL